MDEFGSLVGKVKRLEERNKELLRLVPKLEKTKELVEAEIKTWRHHAANVKEKIDRMEEKIAASKESHNAWIKQTQDELVEREAVLEAEITRRDMLLDDRQKIINIKELELNTREEALQPTEKDLDTRKDYLDKREITLRAKEQSTTDDAKNNEFKRVDLNRRETQINEASAAFEARTAAMEPQLVKNKQLAVEALKDRTATSELLKQAKKRTEQLDERDAILTARDIQQEARDKKIDIREKQITDRQELLTRNLKRISSI